MRPTKKELEKALELEKKRSANLSKKLKQVRADNKQRDEATVLDMGCGSYPRGHSTLRADSSSNRNEASILTSMSFATLNIPECRPCDGEEDIDKKSYEQWKDQLEASMNLVGVSDESMKINIFKIKAGRGLLDVLESTASSSTTPDAICSPYSNAVRRLDDYFSSRDYILLQRQKLRSTMQKAGESDVSYVKRVLAVAKLCEYGEEQLVENVADVLQLHAINVKVREAGRKVSRKGGTLVDLMDKIRAYEIEQLNEAIFAKTHLPNQPNIAAVSHGSQYGGAHQFRGQPFVENRFGMKFGGERGRSTFKRRGNDNNQRVQCWRCTSYYHSPSTCHALEKVCRKCHAKGHIERACRENPRAFPLKRRASEEDATAPKPKRVAAVQRETEDEKDIVKDSVSDLS